MAEASTLSVTQDGPDVLIEVKVVPNASRERIMGALGGCLKLTVAAAPERGAANKAVCKLLSRVLKLRPQQCSVESGHTSPRKTIRIRNVGSAAIRTQLNMIR